MKRILALALLLSLGLADPSLAITAEKIAWAVYNRPIGKDSESHTTMLLLDSRGHQKKRRLYVAVRDEKRARKTLMRFLSPKDIAGTAFLAISYHNGKEEQFLYLPALRRVRRIAGSFRFRRFVNSDFTYEDLERHYPKKYHHQLLREENYRGTACYVLKTWPKKKRDSSYQYWIQWITKEGFLVVKVDYYDRRGHLCKKFEALKWKKIQGYWTVLKSQMLDLKKKHRTVLTVETIKYNVGLKPRIFTKRSLKP